MNQRLLLRLHRMTMVSCLSTLFISSSFSQSNTPCNGSGAPALPVNSSCSYTAGTTVGATQQTNGFNFGTPSCGLMGPDVWYSFTAPASGSVTIDTQAGSITDGVMALYSSTPCDNVSWAQIACDDDSGAGLMPQIVQGALSPGTTYYIRFWRYGGGTGTFGICVVENPPPPPCAGDITVNTTSYTQTGLTTCGFGDDYSSTDACGSSYMNGDDIVIAYTPTTTECVNITLTNTSSWVGLFITDGCPGDAGVNCLASATASGGNPFISSFNVAAGVTYYITVSTWPSPQCTPFDISIAPCPPPPANDECTAATPLTVNPDQNCGTTTAGTIAYATPSYQSNSCGGASDDDDVWYSFVATGTTHTIDLLNVSGSTTDLYHSVWAVGCGSIGSTTAILCSDPNSSTLTGLTPGVTYYVRVYSFGSTAQTTTFDICIGTPPPPPPNDDPCGAIALPVNASCSYTASGNYSATATTGPPAPGCGSFSGGDVWYTVTVPATGTVILNSNTGTMTDGAMAVYSGTCGSLSLIACDDDSSPNGAMPMLTVGGQTPGATLYVRFWGFGGNFGNYGICAYEGQPMGPCGNQLNEDFCDAPAFLTQGPGSWGSSTYPYYTYDMPGNAGSIFCGSVENNSWYEFTAQNTTETFSFAVSNCVNSSGIQAQVYEVVTDVNGCCTNFTSMSNCWNPGTMTSGTVTATGLTVGNNYILMVDGYAGDNCDFTVTNWTATGIQLPVELLNFRAVALPRMNVVEWETASEENCDRFDILRSFDGINYQKIGEVKGAGNSTNLLSYSFEDEDIHTGAVYYKLNQFDLNGSSYKTEPVALNRSISQEGLLASYPNPATSTIFVEVNGKTSDLVELLDIRGMVVDSRELQKAEFVQLQFDVTKLDGGVYFIRYTSTNGTTMTNKIVIR